MKISAIINFLETVAPPALQESYDNSGLITGSGSWDCTGILVSLDATEQVVMEAVSKGYNLIVAHHPIVFSGLKKIDPGHYVGRAVISAIKNDVAIYAIHTNLDNVIEGVNGKMAAMLELKNLSILKPITGQLGKLVSFVPHAHLDKVRNALFQAGAGQIGNYDETGFYSEGKGSFRAGKEANPFVGEKGQRHYEPETRLEVIYPLHIQQQLVAALKEAHPYEEVAYDLVVLHNADQNLGSGMIGELDNDWDEQEFLRRVAVIFGLKLIRHTPLLGRPVRKIAICGGAGSFLISRALRAGADVYITADVKYHEFFEADGKLVIADIGHFESEQFTINLLFDLLQEKFPNFAVLKSGVETNPVQYLI
ncbi:MAG TPA: Nif3-like dinuclear metal center hexameric protein [Chitinophagaceae bacterium]|nr:Nif3-like dinuclear metal center hexameric protein [Chitinophagaceae bacterium]